MNAATSVAHFGVVGGRVVKVELVGPSWWITYLIAPLISVVVALIAAWMAHRFTMREQVKQLRAERYSRERQAQVDQNVEIETFATMLASIDAAAEKAISDTNPPAISVDAIVVLGVKCGLGDQLSELVRSGVLYSSAREKWRAGDQSAFGEVISMARSVKDAVDSVRAVANDTLANGRSRLNQLDLASNA